jgi:hypothetical protein
MKKPRPDDSPEEELSLRVRRAAAELLKAMSPCKEFGMDEQILLREVHEEILPLMIGWALNGSQGSCVDIVDIAFKTTDFLNWVVLNDEGPTANLRLLASQYQSQWPILMAPGDSKLAEMIHTKLGMRAIRSSLATPMNRILRKLLIELQHSIALASWTRQYPKSATLERCLLQNRPDLDSEQRSKLLGLLTSMIESDLPPFSKESAKAWVEHVVEYILIIDPTLEKTPEFHGVLSNKRVPWRMTPASERRSNLNKYVNKYLPRLAV